MLTEKELECFNTAFSEIDSFHGIRVYDRASDRVVIEGCFDLIVSAPTMLNFMENLFHKSKCYKPMYEAMDRYDSKRKAEGRDAAIASLRTYIAEADLKKAFIDRLAELAERTLCNLLQEVTDQSNH